MRKRPMLMLAGVFLLGILWYEQGEPLFLAAFVLLLIYTGAGFWKKKEWKKLLLRCGVLLAVFWVSFFHVRERSLVREGYLGQISDGDFLSVQGEISKKQFKNDQYVYDLKNCYVLLSGESQSCGGITVWFSSDEYSIGQTLVIEGQVNLFAEAVNEGMFDTRSFYRSQGIDFCMYDPQVSGVYGAADRIAEGLYRLRCRLADTIGALVDAEEAGVLSGMLLGDRSLIDDETKALYQSAGISHVLAISGLHVSIFAAGLYRLLRRRRMGFWSAGAAAGVFVLLYAQMTGAGVSTQRAAAMFLIFVAAQAVGRSYDMLNALGICVIWLLWENPFLYGYAGFVFSVAAMLGIGLTVQAFSDENGGRLREALVSGIGIQLATLPVVAYYYYELPSYAVLLNLAVLPLLPVVLLSGALGAGVGCVWPELGRLCILPAKHILKGYRWACGICSGLPFSQIIVGKPSAAKLLAYYLILCGMTYVQWKRKQGRRGEQKKTRRIHPAVWPGMAALLFLLYYRTPVGAQIDMLDVGQGDGIFFSAGDGTCFFLDGGSSNVGSVGTYRILPFLKAKGIAQIDYWLISHADADHVSGAKEVLESGYPVAYLVLAEGIVRDEAYEELVSLAEKSGTKLLYLDTGEALVTKEARLTCLFPDGDGSGAASGSDSADRNAQSLVLLFETEGLSCLFPGDVTAEQEALLLDLVPQVDVYKAAHHGSNYSNSPELLEALSPQVALISCSSTNTYGHPGAEAVAHMEAVGAEIYCTMEQGQITVVPTENGVEVSGFLGGDVGLASMSKPR